KPLMAAYLRGLEDRLRASGFAGRLLMVTSSGGVVDAADMAAAPIHSVNSGPAMAPIAGRYYAALDGLSEDAVVADTGGTSYDVALVRRGRIPVTRETWLGLEYEGHITGFPAVDVRSVGTGGGSIAWIDAGGLLHVGPQSAAADPGPVCYSRGGTEPTVTDAAVVLGYIDPDYFLGGKMALDAGASQRPRRLDVGPDERIRHGLLRGIRCLRPRPRGGDPRGAAGSLPAVRRAFEGEGRAADRVRRRGALPPPGVADRCAAARRARRSGGARAADRGLPLGSRGDLRGARRARGDRGGQPARTGHLPARRRRGRHDRAGAGGVRARGPHGLLQRGRCGRSGDLAPGGDAAGDAGGGAGSPLRPH